MATALLTGFAKDVQKGLSAEFKHIPSKYFYDDEGSRIFTEIMAMPEYYPTRCEMEILQRQSGEIFKAFNPNLNTMVIELGCGDGTKTRHLLQVFARRVPLFRYLPVDISEKAIALTERQMHEWLPEVTIESHVGDYFDILRSISDQPDKKLFLFLGGNIGNYLAAERSLLLQNFYDSMNPGDMLLIGFDLKKNPHVIRKAYDDPNGITKAFNLNLLVRMNRELGTNFDLSDFGFYADYHPKSGEVNSFLVSLKKQDVYSSVLRQTFAFSKDELIWTEVSKKYSFTEIEKTASDSGFAITRNFTDSKGYFCDSLWIK